MQAQTRACAVSVGQVVTCDLRNQSVQCALSNVLAASSVGQSLWSWLSNSKPVRIQYAGFVSVPTCGGKPPHDLMHTCNANDNSKHAVCMHALLHNFLWA